MIAILASAASAQPRRPPPGQAFGFDPRRMFEQMFGQQTEARKKALARVKISWKEEQEFGNRAAEAYISSLRRQGIRVVQRGADVQYLQQLVHVPRGSMQHADRYRRITIHVADSPKTDARSFPGGTLIVFRGMLDFAESEAALIGILGHELSHMDRGHQLQRLRTIKLAQSTFQPGNRPADIQQMISNGMMLAGMFSRPFHPEDEAEADIDGATWAYRAGYDPRELARVFRRLHKRDRAGGDAVPMFFRTHPYHENRYEAVMQRYKALEAEDPRRNLYIGRTNLQRRIPRSKRRFPE